MNHVSERSPGRRAREVAARAVERDPRWIALANRDPGFDGTFVYAVKTTGVYCRPTCPARRAKPENVVFYATCAQAERAGFRPCRRCEPNGCGRHQSALVTAACRRIEGSEEPLRLDALAAQAGMSAFHFHRLFKSITGLTPKAYGAAQRAKKLRSRLGDGRCSVTEAIYGAGFTSAGRFYESSNGILGMTPKAFRAGGTDAAIKFAIGECSLGSILVACSEKGVCAIMLGDDPDALARELQDQFPKADLIGGDAAFETRVARIIGFVESPRMGLNLPLDIRGTSFQQRVWQALREIPAGETASYAEVARRIGAPASARAVARACADNKIAVAIPCHRVLRSDGAISGYRWGVVRKRALLAKERKE